MLLYRSPWTSITLNHLMGTLKTQRNGPLYNNTVIGTMAVDGWAVTFGTARRSLGGLRPRQVPSSVITVPNLGLTFHSSTVSVPTSCYFLHSKGLRRWGMFRDCVFFCRAMLCISGRCMSVCLSSSLSVTFVHSVE